MVPDDGQDNLKLQGQRFLRQQAPIDAVLDHGFRFGGNHNAMSHEGSLMGLPGRTQAWDAPADAHDLSSTDLWPVFEVADDIDLLVIGTGNEMAFVPDAIRDAARDAGFALEISPTRAAVRTYNILLSEDRRVAAALMVLT